MTKMEVITLHMVIKIQISAAEINTELLKIPVFSYGAGKITLISVKPDE